MPKPKSKYAHVTATLPKLPLVEPERRDIVEAVKAEILAAEAPDLDTTPLEQVQIIEGAVQKLLTYEKRVTGGRQSTAAFGHAYGQLRLIKSKMEEWTANFQLLLDAYQSLLIDQMEVDNLDAVRLGDNGGSISTSKEPYGQVKDKEAFRLWCINICQSCGFHKNDHPMHDDDGNIFCSEASTLEKSMQLWPSTMNSLVKERTLEGEPPPDGVEVFAKTVVRFNT